MHRGLVLPIVHRDRPAVAPTSRLTGSRSSGLSGPASRGHGLPAGPGDDGPASISPPAAPTRRKQPSSTAAAAAGISDVTPSIIVTSSSRRRQRTGLRQRLEMARYDRVRGDKNRAEPQKNPARKLMKETRN